MPYGGSDLNFQNGAINGLGTPDVAAILRDAGDLTLVIDKDGVILDMSTSVDFPELSQWIGKSFRDVVTVESRPKVDQMLAGEHRGTWRQVNHPTSGSDLALRYRTVTLSDGRHVAIGRDMREAAQLQQRLLRAQQSLERDYLKLRNTEQRYRLLFDQSADPLLIVEAASRKVREANPAAHSLFSARAGALVGKKLTSLFAKTLHDDMISLVGKSLQSGRSVEMTAEAGKPVREHLVSASAFRQDGEPYVLVRMVDGATVAMGERERLVLELVDAMPDAFVVADESLEIVAVNDAFVDAVGAVTGDVLIGKPLAELLGRPGIDLDLVIEQLARSGSVRNIGTVLRGIDGGGEEEVELSAVRVEGEPAHYGFSLRTVGRRLRDLPPTQDDLPRSVEQLTDLVGRMSLKDIVRESTDLIERLCIEAALNFTEDNRASAAEILGVSRQSLYSKLNRYGLSRAGEDD